MTDQSASPAARRARSAGTDEAAEMLRQIDEMLGRMARNHAEIERLRAEGRALGEETRKILSMLGARS